MVKKWCKDESARIEYQAGDWRMTARGFGGFRYAFWLAGASELPIGHGVDEAAARADWWAQVTALGDAAAQALDAYGRDFNL